MKKCTIIFTHRALKNKTKSDLIYEDLKKLLLKKNYQCIRMNISKQNDELKVYLKVNNEITSKQIDFCIVIDDYGVYPFITLTKYPKHYVAYIEDEHSAYMTRLHNNANVIIFSQELNSLLNIHYLLSAYLESHYEAGRHKVRIDMLDEILNKGVK